MATYENLISDGCLINPSWYQRPREPLVFSLVGGLKKLGADVSGGWQQQQQGICTQQGALGVGRQKAVFPP